MAGLLAGRNVDCVLIDASLATAASRLTRTDSRTLALTPASRNILESLDAWSKLPADRIGRFQRMHVWDENGQGEIFFNCAELNQPVLGYIVEQTVLQYTLEQVLSGYPSLKIYRGHAVTGIEPGDGLQTVRMEDRSVSAKLVIAADGANSTARMLAGIGTSTRDYRQQALTCVVKMERRHDEVARQRFLSDGPLAFLPMAEPDQCGIVWSTSPQYAGLLSAMHDANFRRVLRDAFESTLGEVLENGPLSCFPLQRVEAVSYCRERFVLIGDAAHSIHPLAGQGANLGLLDAASLGQVILAARDKSKDPGNLNILRRYERWRKAENRIMMTVMDGFKYLFEDQSPPLPLLRNAGMDLVDSLLPVKKWIMCRAMGLAGDVPEIVQPQRI